jgi:CRISPR-associated protein Csh1
MIQEIQNFVEHINLNDKNVFSRNLKLKEGIYILLDIKKDADNYILLNEHEIYDTQEDLIINDSKNEISEADALLAIVLNTIPVSPAKILNPGKKVFNMTCSPFALGFNKKNYNNKSSQIIIGSLAEYFKGAEKYVEKDNTQHQIWFHDFKGFCLSRLVSFMESLKAYKDAKTNTNIYLILKGPAIDDFLETHQAYLSDKVFNKEEFNVMVEDETYGISDSMSGFNVKKMFLKHQTAPLEYNFRVNGEVAMQLWRFFQLQQNKQIPNPIPIFIDQKELNDKMIKIFNADKDYKMGHAEMVKSILNNTKENLQNFYLIYFQGTKGSRIADIDFIPLFKYEEKDAKIVEVFKLGGNQEKNRIENVFDLENLVFNKIFNGQLKVNNWLKYFDEIKFDKYFTNTTYNQMLKYRKSIYDFIYKSERNSINSLMFDDMMSQTILSDIRDDEVIKNKNFTKNDTSIKQKLNIWFSLYAFFNHTNSKNRINMINQTEELQIKVRELASQENDLHLDNDIAFAFSAGQIIHYLLNQSEAGNRTHALLEPFLQKTDANQLKLAIARTFDMYKHAIIFYKRKFEFDKLMAEVMGYVPDEKNMKNLLPFILAGYFSKSIFY